MPRIARPSLMWSSVVTIFAVSAGLRNVLAPTISPSVARDVTPAQPARIEVALEDRARASRPGSDRGDPMSRASRSRARRRAGRLPGAEAQSVRWPHGSTPTLMSPVIRPPFDRAAARAAASRHPGRLSGHEGPACRERRAARVPRSSPRPIRCRDMRPKYMTLTSAQYVPATRPVAARRRRRRPCRRPARP